MSRRHFLHRISRLFKEEKKRSNEKKKVDMPCSSQFTTIDDTSSTCTSELSISELSISELPSYNISACGSYNSLTEPFKIGLADQVKLILSDAIDLADKELEQDL